jgi:DNA-binding NarL/FixJ family response regulator
MQVLIVDNSIQIIERLEEILFEAGNIAAIHKASSYEEAKKLFKENKYDAVLLDNDLPGNESLKLLKEIKKTGEKTCIIILFTHMDNYIQEQCKYLGVDFFLDKYCDFEKIYGVIKEHHFMNTKNRREVTA